MSKPKYAGKSRKNPPAPLVGVLVPKDEDKAPLIKALSNNPDLERYAVLSAMHILQTWSALATVDVNEIVRVEKQACRYCHGYDHRYQWSSDDEWAMEVAEAIDRGREPKPCDGGFGYDPHAKPHGECPSCHGDGVATVVLADYRDLSPAARLLYNGAKVDKDGHIKVELRDRDKLMEMAGKYLGMFKETIEHQGKGGGAIQLVLSPTEAAL